MPGSAMACPRSNDEHIKRTSWWHMNALLPPIPDTPCMTAVRYWLLEVARGFSRCGSPSGKRQLAAVYLHSHAGLNVVPASSKHNCSLMAKCCVYQDWLCLTEHILRSCTPSISCLSMALSFM